MAGISWQPCCSSSEGYLVLRSDQKICSQWRFGMQENPAAPRGKLICLGGDRVRRTYWVDGTTLGCAQVTCTGLSLLRVSKNPSPAVLGGLLSYSSVQNCWVLLSQLPHPTAGSAPVGDTSGQWHQSPFVWKEGKNLICSSNNIFLCQWIACPSLYPMGLREFWGKCSDFP